MRKRIVVDLKVTIDPPASAIRWIIPRKGESHLEAEERALNEWAREFEEFVRDHRSQDAVSITVERVEQDICTMCGLEWEQDAATGEPLCCNAAIAAWSESVEERSA